ncbi:MAG: ABC-type transport auxiliary lipoprotein family protein [Polymorphobacter sp.]
MKPWVPALAALALISCGPLVQIGGNAKPPQSLLTLSATATPRPYAGPARTADTIGIDLPGVPATLQTLRLPVTTNATETSYLVGATWAEQPNRQFQRLLADTLAANGIAVIDARQSAIAPARSITGSLRSFGLDMTDPASPVVRVRYDAQLSGGKVNAGEVAMRRFDASEPAPSQSPTAVAAALNRAANRVAAEVAAWAQG